MLDNPFQLLPSSQLEKIKNSLEKVKGPEYLLAVLAQQELIVRFLEHPATEINYYRHNSLHY